MSFSWKNLKTWFTLKNVLVFLIGLFIIPSLVYFSSFLNYWQQLMGSFIGAATPIAFYLWNEHRQENLKRNEQYQYLIIVLSTAINNLSEIDENLHRFLEGNLKKYVIRLKKAIVDGDVAVGQTFIPLAYFQKLETDNLKVRLQSSYLENLVTQAISQSQQFAVIMEDIHRQFDRTLALNTELGIHAPNSVKGTNETLLANLEGFEKFITGETLRVNIPLYLRHLVQTLVAVEEMHEIGLRAWKKKFNYKRPLTFGVIEKMNAYFKDRVNLRIKEIQKSFKSKLLEVGEEIEPETN